MSKKKSDLYLYLARRDGTGVKIVSKMAGIEQPPVRLKDLRSLQLPANVHMAIQKIIHDERMLWEPWIESAESFEALRTSLKKRGLSGLPLHGQPAIMAGLMATQPAASTNNLPKATSMIRKKA